MLFFILIWFIFSKSTNKQNPDLENSGKDRVMLHGREMQKPHSQKPHSLYGKSVFFYLLYFFRSMLLLFVFMRFCCSGIFFKNNHKSIIVVVSTFLFFCVYVVAALIVVVSAFLFFCVYMLLLRLCCSWFCFKKLSLWYFSFFKNTDLGLLIPIL
jgi:hypothetical protein